MKNSKKILIVSGATAVSLLIAMPAMAATASTTAKSARNGAVHSLAEFRERHEHLTTHAAFGTIESVQANSITISHKTKTGTKTFTVGITGTTVFKTNGVKGANTLAVGQKAVAMGVKDANGNIANATSVNVFVRKAK